MLGVLMSQEQYIATSQNQPDKMQLVVSLYSSLPWLLHFELANVQAMTGRHRHSIAFSLYRYGRLWPPRKKKRTASFKNNHTQRAYWFYVPR